MKKKLLLIPLFATLLCGCTLEDLMFWKKKEEEQSQKEDEKPKPSEVKVTSVNIVKDSTSIEEMQSEVLSYTVSPSNATNKDVEWSTSDPTVVSVNNGTVYALNPGTATITVTTKDGGFTDTCSVTVTAKPIEGDTTTRTLDFNAQGYTFSDSIAITDPFVIDDITFEFSQGENPTNAPKIFKHTQKKEYAARLYPNNTLTVTSGDYGPFIRSIVLTYGTDDGSNTITTVPEGFNVDTWTGMDTTITFTIGGTSGNRRIKSIAVTYDGSDPDPEELINLGVKSIAEVKQYIEEHPVSKNSFGNGVNQYRVVTIKGFALAKIDLVKFKSEFGLDVSYPAKVIMADASGSIGVATDVSGDGTTLWGKIDDHVCKETAKYVVTGYLSEYLGHPEIMVTSFSWDQNLDISWSKEIISEETLNLSEFYNEAQNVNYNCAGHGYGKVVTLNNLKCFNLESGGSGKRYYNFTDGTKNLRVNAFNLSTVTVGSIYNVTGIISVKNLSPIIIAFDLSKVNDATPFDFDYMSASQNITIEGLRAIHGSQDDTSDKYPAVIAAYGNVYRTTGYLAIVEEGGKLYVGLADSYKGENFISGKTNAMANYGIALIKNDDFWNTTEDALSRYNPFYEDYLCEDLALDVYYIPRQQEFSSNKTCWEILLIPEFVDSYKA